VERVSPNRLWHLLVNVLAASAFLTEEQRVALLARGGIQMNGTSIRPGCWFESDRITFGPGGMVNREVMFANNEQITIGARVFFGPGVKIITTTHDLGPASQRAGTVREEAVSIGAGSWIGANATILSGVSIGAGCVVAAGAVVTRDLPANHLCAGIPAVPKRELGGEPA
jgi:maltose O-acetyltransferase